MSAVRGLLHAAFFVAAACSGEVAGPTPVSELRPGSLSANGLDSVRLARLVTDIRTGRYRDIHSLLIVRNGQLVLEEYFNGGAANLLHTLQSVSKSVTSALIGIAIEEGSLTGVDERVVDFFPAWRDDLITDARRARQRIEDVLTMRTGTDYVEGYTGSPHDSLNRLPTGWDWFWLHRPMPREPGTFFQYDSGGVIALSSVLRSRTGAHADVYAGPRLFAPLGITQWQWIRNQEGHPHTGGGLYLTSRDMAKFGQLFLQGGKWGDSQVVPAAWVRESFRKHVTFSPARGPQTGYGYLWWIVAEPHGGHEEVRAALGFMGQHIFVIPSHQMVVVVTAGARDPIDMNRPSEFLYADIFPAILR